MYSAYMFLNDVDKLLDKIRKEGNYKMTIPSNYSTSGLPSQYCTPCKEIKIPVKDIEQNHKKKLENRIQRVKFDNPWTIVWWNDGSITRVKCSSLDTFTEESGLMAAICKHYYEDTNIFGEMLHKWCKPTPQGSLADLDAAYDAGYNDGYATGYEDGDCDGRLAEHDEAHDKGWALGYNSGYEQGYSDGKTL